MRQLAVAFIVWAWKIMPERLRLWAFLNDNAPEGQWSIDLADWGDQ